LLGISAEEGDPKVIEEAALQQAAHVRVYQLTREPECTLRLNAIAQALLTLLDPVRRREYDRSLGKPLTPALSDRRPGERDAPVLRKGKSALPAPGEDTLVLHVSEGGNCDVRLVFQEA
jgi:hypothetical protein